MSTITEKIRRFVGSDEQTPPLRSRQSGTGP